MSSLEQISQTLTNPAFYRKRIRGLARMFRRFEDDPKWQSVSALEAAKSVVLVIAHPDDETFASGLLCELVDAGSQVDVICVTRGEGGPAGKVTRGELGAVRSVELRKACDVLGLGEIHFLEHRDPIGSDYRAWAPDVSTEDLAEQIAPLISDADLVVSHGSSGEYWHPAHLLVCASMKRSVSDFGESGPAWLTMMARNSEPAASNWVNLDDEAHFRINVSAHAEKRATALQCHETQLSLFEKWMEGSALEFIQRNPEEHYSLQRRGKLEIPEPADVGEGRGNH